MQQQQLRCHPQAVCQEGEVKYVDPCPPRRRRQPSPLRSISSCQTPLIVDDVINRGQRWQHQGVWGVVIRTVEEEEVRTIVLGHQVWIQPGVDNEGRRSSATLVGLRGQERQAGEGGEVGTVSRGRQQ